MRRKILLGLLLLLVAIQFVRPTKNQSTGISVNDISKGYKVPENVNEVLKKACNDCHSNNTVYPWYNKIQPVAWWLAGHIDEGKTELNFSEFVSYSPKKQHHKLEEVIESVKEGHMPIKSYTWIHKNAILTDEEKLAVSEWAENLRMEIRIKHNLPVEQEK
jgi:hypothetical protein